MPYFELFDDSRGGVLLLVHKMSIKFDLIEICSSSDQNAQLSVQFTFSRALYDAKFDKVSLGTPDQLPCGGYN